MSILLDASCTTSLGELSIEVTLVAEGVPLATNIYECKIEMKLGEASCSIPTTMTLAPSKEGILYDVVSDFFQYFPEELKGFLQVKDAELIWPNIQIRPENFARKTQTGWVQAYDVGNWEIKEQLA
jgi:hypothetical protein